MSASTDKTEAVEAVVELLETASNDTWTNEVPNVYPVWEVSQSERQGTKHPTLYVWSPVDGSERPLSSFDYDKLDKQPTIEVQCWTLNESNTSVLASDVIDFLAFYGNDNESNTPFHRIRPDTSADNRAQKQARRSEHFVYTVTVNMRLLHDL